MRVILVVINAVALGVAALAAQDPGPVVVHVPAAEPTWMVVSGAALLAAGAAIKRAG